MEIQIEFVYFSFFTNYARVFFYDIYEIRIIILMPFNSTKSVRESKVELDRDALLAINPEKIN